MNDAAPSRPKPVLDRDATGLATYYNLIMKDRGFQLPPHLTDPVRALMDDRIRSLELILGPGSGKSLLLSVVYPSFEFGHDPTLTCLGISAGEALPQGFMKSTMELVEYHPSFRYTFPGVLPDKDSGWSTERGMYVTGRNPGDPDATYFAAGLTSSTITGKHGRLIIIDDLHNEENASSEEACLKVRDRYYNTIIGRADPRGARFVAAGRRWHTADIYGHLRDSGDWVVMELQALREGETELYWDVTLPPGLQCCFTEDGVEMGDVIA